MAKVNSGNNKYFNLPAGHYCGLVLEKDLAVRVQKLLAKQSEELKALIGARIDEVHVADWTLAYPDGEQTTVNYTTDIKNKKSDKQERLNLISREERISVLPNFYFVTEEEGDDFSTVRDVVINHFESIHQRGEQ